MEQLKLFYTRFQIYINNSSWVLLSLIIRSLITIFIVSKIAQVLGVTEFGWYNFGISIFTILQAISTLGLNYSFIIKFLAKNEYKNEDILGTALITRLVISSIIILILVFWVFFFQTDSNYWGVVIVCLSIIFQSSDIISSYFQYKLKAKIYIPVTILALVIEALLLIYGIHNKLGLFFFISIYSLERLIILVGLLICLNKEIKLKTLHFNKNLFGPLIIQAWPLLMGALLTALYSRFDQVLIKHYLSPTDLGIYGTAIILTQIWNVIPPLINPVIFSKVADLKNRKNKTKYYDLIYFLYGLYNYLAIGIIIFIFLFGKHVILYLYGEDYIDSFLILKISCINLIFTFQSKLTTNIMTIENEQKFIFKIKLVSVASTIILNVLFLATMGVKFAAYSLLCSSFISWFLMSFLNKKMLKLLVINLKSFFIPFKYKKILKVKL